MAGYSDNRTPGKLSPALLHEIELFIARVYTEEKPAAEARETAAHTVYVFGSAASLDAFDPADALAEEADAAEEPVSAGREADAPAAGAKRQPQKNRLEKRGMLPVNAARPAAEKKNGREPAEGPDRRRFAAGRELFGDAAAQDRRSRYDGRRML